MSIVFLLVHNPHGVENNEGQLGVYLKMKKGVHTYFLRLKRVLRVKGRGTLKCAGSHLSKVGSRVGGNKCINILKIKLQSEINLLR